MSNGFQKELKLLQEDILKLFMKKTCLRPSFETEIKLRSEGHALIAGVDEVGRGALAGPIVAAAVVFDVEKKFEGLNRIIDSKRLSKEDREDIEKIVRREAISIGIGSVEVSEIDKFGIGKANILAFDRALTNIEISCGRHCEKSSPKQSDASVIPDSIGDPQRDCHDYQNSLAMTDKVNNKVDYVLIDGRNFRGFNYKFSCIEKGESKSISIAAASIVAKVYRDNLMNELHVYNSIYGFDTHKGYGAKSHIEAIKTHGPSIYHRKSFLRKVLSQNNKFDLK